MHTPPIYQREDPCLDGYFSPEKQHLIFGARRFGPTGLISNAMVCGFSPLPSHKALGDALLLQLSLTKEILLPNATTYHDIQSGKYDPILISEAESCEEFTIQYHSFALWTKDDKNTPYFIGVPASDRFPLYKNSRPIQKPTSSENLGSEFIKFLNDFII